MTSNAYLACLIILLCNIFVLHCTRFELKYDISTFNTYLPNVKFIDNTAFSFQQCMDICNRFGYCKSVNFHKGSKMCTLNYKAADPPGTIQPRYSTVPQAGYRYMEKASFPVIFLNKDCMGHSCSPETLCIGQSDCPKWLYNDCGMVDEDLSAITEYPVNGDFDTAIHTCLRAPPGSSGVTIRQCNKLTGQWSVPSKPCPTNCLSPPKVREEQQISYEYPGGGVVRAYYSCSSFPDTVVTPSCRRSECVAGENWGWIEPVRLSCSPFDCWTPGQYYHGGVSCTANGRTCQRWDTDSPHIRAVIPAYPVDNYCRTDEHTQPWCYTTDPNVRWEICEVQLC